MRWLSEAPAKSSIGSSSCAGCRRTVCSIACSPKSGSAQTISRDSTKVLARFYQAAEPSTISAETYADRFVMQQAENRSVSLDASSASATGAFFRSSMCWREGSSRIVACEKIAR